MKLLNRDEKSTAYRFIHDVRVATMKTVSDYHLRDGLVGSGLVVASIDAALGGVPVFPSIAEDSTCE